MSSTFIPTTARTLLLTDLDTSALSFIPNHPVPVPTPESSEHLIHVHSTALCAQELLWPRDNPVSNKTLVPGYDLAGVVITAPASSPFRPGERVYASTNYYRSEPGCAREYTIALTEELARVPKGMDMTTAATVPLSALTAWQALLIQSGFGKDAVKGKRLLVTAASGGVGIWLVQLAKVYGMEVVGTCGTDNVEFVRSLGADDVVDYRKAGLKEWVNEGNGKREFDLVVDCVGGKVLEEVWYTVRPDGVVLSIVSPPDEKRPKELERKMEKVESKFFIIESNGGQLDEITSLLEKGRVRAVVDSVWEFPEYAKAFEKVNGGHARGKVVLKIHD